MDALRRRLMLQESEKWAEAAEALSDAALSSDASYILKLLSFELLLKLLVEEHCALCAPKHHRYQEIFLLLPDQIRHRLLELAGESIGPSGLSKKPLEILREFGQNFSALRYPWERYQGVSEAQYSSLGEAWLTAGAPLKEATFRYYPEELYGLTHAARILVGF